MKLKKESLAFLLVFLLGSIFSGNAQNNSAIQIKTVFNQLVTAYGSSKSAPELVVLNDKLQQKTPAFYHASPKPKINVDAHFYSLCRTFGKDSLNALSIVLSHELAHYYNDHTFCSDFAFAVSKDNKAYAGKLKLVSRTEKMSLETQADYKGLFYSAMAGYSPFEIHPKLLDAIYKAYLLKDENEGYPSKTERKEIGLNALLKANDLFVLFQNGLKYTEQKEYDKAIVSFEEVNRYFPSRENYNNIGVAKARKALLLKVKTSEEFKFPERFLYPLEIENKSRLSQEVTRAIDDDNQEKMEQLLTSAQKDFQEAIRLDPKFTKGYINLACVYELQGKFNLALGTIQELPKEQQKSNEAQRILAITYFHNEQENKAIAIWEEIKM